MLTANQEFIDDLTLMYKCYDENKNKETEGNVLFNINLPTDDLKEYLPDVLIYIIEQYLVNGYNQQFRLRLNSLNDKKNNYGISYLVIYFSTSFLDKNIIEWSISMENLYKHEKHKIVDNLEDMLLIYRFRKRHNSGGVPDNINPITYIDDVDRIINNKYYISSELHLEVFRLIIFLRNLIIKIIQKL
jgi:hypothetical protein